MSVKFLELPEYIEILPEHLKWKESEYRSTYWNVDELKSVPADTVKIVKSASTEFSSVQRERILNRSVVFSLDTLDTLASIITILDKTTNKTIICGFVYGRYYPEDQYKKITSAEHKPHHLRYSNNIISYYWNIGPSLESVDGEYRNQFADFTGMYKVKSFFPELHKDMLGYLKKEIDRRKYSFNRETFFPTAKLKQYEINLEQHFKEYQMELNLYMMVWYIGVYRKITNIREDHINKRYISFIDKHITKDTDFFKTLIKKYTQPTMELVYRYFSNTCLPGKTRTTVLGLGQKLMPLNLLEVQTPFDVRFVPWKDYLVSQALGKLVINNICPGFPVVNSWMYIKGSEKGLFNNKIQYQRIERSDQAKSIIDLLVKAKSYTYQNIKQKSIKKIRGTVTSWLSDKFKVLHDQIDDAVNFGKNEIIMSNVSFMIISEYAGRTLNDSLRLTKSSPYYNESLGKPFTSGGYKYFKKYVFDLCYNLYCMFEYNGIIHGDLHLNNLTLYQKFHANDGLNKVKDPHVAYVMGENNEYCFVLPSLSTHTTIIDFGRCFIHPDKLELLRDESVPKKYEVTGNKEKFIKEQIRRLICVYIHLVPSAKDQKPELKVLFTKNFNAIYKLMSVSDLFNVMTKLNLLFSLKLKDVVSPHANCIFLIKKIIDLCSIYLISDVSKLMADKSYGDAIEEGTSPLLNIILKLFSDNLSTSTTKKNIIDVFLYNNPIKYSLDFMENSTPILRTKKYKDKTGKLVEFSSHGIEQLKKSRIIYEECRVKNFDIVDLIARRHKEKIF